MEGIEIRRIREGRGWSQRKLAEYLGVEQATVSRLERDEWKASGPVLKLLDMLEPSRLAGGGLTRPHCQHTDRCAAMGEGHCRACNMAAKNADPAFRERQAAAVKAKGRDYKVPNWVPPEVRFGGQAPSLPRAAAVGGGGTGNRRGAPAVVRGKDRGQS